ncbi:methyltransferase domain-containing protein [Aliarcobacter cryaerophilus]|uniref:methyltransferase domain-containing protein n=1 Tax=Aliarcobacter cryaerophilus TaxID=28198 RepID=UPI00082A2957|nr:methyltransferase domain-containing protein [Aliarcobacter cryaerophilus]
MRECSKSILRRLSNSNFISRYFAGCGIDIGGKPDPLSLYESLFPLIKGIKIWDIDDGDAQFLDSINDESYDFVHSSHCLEHLNDPFEGINNWFRILKKGGYLILTIPDEDLYEQGIFPSTFNKDHKWTFSIYKKISWSSKSINVFQLIQSLNESAVVEKIELLNSTYRYDIPRYDQSLTPVAECGIEIIIRKATDIEIEKKGNIVRPVEIKKDIEHFNQYKDDIETLKSSNKSKPPFRNFTKLNQNENY